MSERLVPATVSLAAAWPLVGRESELLGIARAREDRRCRGIVVSAGAGVGKSRLAREAQAAAEAEGVLVDWVQATRSAAAVPLGAFAGLIPDEVRSDDALELMRRSVDALRSRAGTRRVLIGVDDAQLLDPVSAALVLHLAVTDSAFVLATVRSDEPCPDAIVSLWKDAGARRIELERLSDDAVGRLVETALGGPVEQRALGWVVERSQGNALYARELVLGAVEAGTLVQSGGLWQLTRRPAVSRTLIELVGQRMTGLSDADREPLELLALGEPLRIAEIASLTSYEAVASAEAMGLVSVGTESPEGEVRLAHPLYGEALRADLPSIRAGGLRLRLAGAIAEREPFASGDALRVARLRLDAGAPIPSAMLLDAARAANLAGDPDLGAELAQRSVEDGGGVEATLLLSRAHVVRNRFEDAEATLAPLEERMAGHPAAIDYLEQRAHVLFWGLNRPAQARALLELARGWAPGEDWRRRLEPLRLGYAREIADAVPTLREVLEYDGLDASTRRKTARRLAVALFFSGCAREASALVARFQPAIPLRLYGDALALGIWRLIRMESGEDWPGLDAYMAEVLREGVRANDHEAAGHGALGLAYTAFLRGRHRDAARWLAEAELHFERQDTFGNLLHVAALRVGVEHYGGDAEAAVAAYERLQRALAGHDPLSSQIPYIARAEGWALQARGDVAGARQALLASAERLEEAMPGYAAQLVYEAMRAGEPAARAAERLRALLPRCDGRLFTAYGAHAEALAARDGAALLAVAGEMAACGPERYGMEAAIQAAGEFLRAGREDSARRALARARELYAPGHGAPEPAVDGLDAMAVELTPRERQLTELAAQGLTNAEIAERLVLSVRTVETHIYRAMQKLGVSDRREL
jgi:DNA-binding NarL/FixJ family response regulator